MGCFRSEILHGGAGEVLFTDLSLGTERGKGGRDVGLRASRRLDNQAEWQLLVHLPSTPCSRHRHGNSSSIQGFQRGSASRGGLYPPPAPSHQPSASVRWAYRGSFPGEPEAVLLGPSWARGRDKHGMIPGMLLRLYLPGLATVWKRIGVNRHFSPAPQLLLSSIDLLAPSEWRVEPVSSPGC